MYDLIGDIHGHADALVRLLDALGYRKTGGVYGHPERRVIFLGDFVDRGPQIRQALAIVRPMVKEGKALAVMGNHEFNTIAYHTKDPEHPGAFLRRHTPKNDEQRRETAEQLTPAELADYLAWFRTLPMWLDLDGLRVVHACWDERAVAAVAPTLEKERGVSDALLQSACTKGSALFNAVEIILKGKEVPLPDGLFFADGYGSVRTEMRTRWYLSPEGHTYRTYALQADEVPCNDPLAQSVLDQAAPYPADAKPVFVGHYWLSAPRPEILATNVACLDYRVLCAYRWQGEQKLSNDHFV